MSGAFHRLGVVGIVVFVALLVSIAQAAKDKGPELLGQQAFSVSNFSLTMPLFEMSAERLVLVPVSKEGRPAHEFVFLGDARIRVTAPDRVESQQLILFSGQEAIDETVTNGVLVLSDANQSWESSSVAEFDSKAAETLWRRWRASKDRRDLRVEFFKSMLGRNDPVANAAAMIWLPKSPHGTLVYRNDPSEPAQTSFGRFYRVETTFKQRAQAERAETIARWRGVLVSGEILDDFYETWVRWDDLREAELPRVDSIDVEIVIDKKGESLRGEGRVAFAPFESSRRSIPFLLNGALKIESIRSPDLGELEFVQGRGRVLVLLPETLSEGAAPTLEISYEGEYLVRLRRKTYGTANHTDDWYPQGVGQVFAPVKAKFHWPKKFDVLIGGELIDRGQEGNQKWESRESYGATSGLTFELGDFEIFEREVEGVKVRLARSRVSKWEKGAAEILLDRIASGVTFLSREYGPYRYDDLTVATSTRMFSQSKQGLITLADIELIYNDPSYQLVFGDDVQQTIVHELAHQWFPSLGLSAGPRDRWMSEGVANFVSIKFGEKRSSRERVASGLVTSLRNTVTARVQRDLRADWVGPMALASRLFSSKCYDCHLHMQYNKGALVFTTAEYMLGPGRVRSVLQKIAAMEGLQSLTTWDLFHRLQDGIDEPAIPMLDRLVNGTGLPMLTYRAKIQSKDKYWSVSARIEQVEDAVYNPAVVQRPDGSLDVQYVASRPPGEKPRPVPIPVEYRVWVESGDTQRRSFRSGKVVIGPNGRDIAMTSSVKPVAFTLHSPASFLAKVVCENCDRKLELILDAQADLTAGEIDPAREKIAELVQLTVEVVTQTPILPVASFYVGGVKVEAEKDLVELLSLLDLLHATIDAGSAEAAKDVISHLEDRVELIDLEPFLKFPRWRLALLEGKLEKAYKEMWDHISRVDEPSSRALMLYAVMAKASGDEDTLEKTLKKLEPFGHDVELLRAR